jgi:hypothetical protein
MAKAYDLFYLWAAAVTSVAVVRCLPVVETAAVLGSVADPTSVVRVYGHGYYRHSRRIGIWPTYTIRYG